MVELAVDSDGRRVARKHVPLTGSQDEMAVARMRLRREARVLAALHHPAIVSLLAVEDDGADVVIVMPALAGSLTDRVAASGPLDVSGTWRIGRPLIDALAWAHRRGIVHRDIKPANVLFDEAGNPALADFGIAWSRDLTGGLTKTGIIMGTPAFIAPEQARGERAGPASDVFSLGATLRYALTGQGPYRGGDPGVLAVQAARGDVTPLPSWVPDALALPLAAMLDPRPEQRPYAAELLGAATDGHLLPPPPVRLAPDSGSGDETGAATDVLPPEAEVTRQEGWLRSEPGAEATESAGAAGPAEATSTEPRWRGEENTTRGSVTRKRRVVLVSVVMAALVGGAVVAVLLARAATKPSSAGVAPTCRAAPSAGCRPPPPVGSVPAAAGATQPATVAIGSAGGRTGAVSASSLGVSEPSGAGVSGPAARRAAKHPARHRHPAAGSGAISPGAPGR